MSRTTMSRRGRRTASRTAPAAARTVPCTVRRPGSGAGVGASGGGSCPPGRGRPDGVWTRGAESFTPPTLQVGRAALILTKVKVRGVSPGPGPDVRARPAARARAAGAASITVGP
ncbi:hypothetical protein GCM10010182_73720 [Actinomadura cremea]|nr:hypothetical protein GCM10010182_73720 [Actinomadura cremea]